MDWDTVNQQEFLYIVSGGHDVALIPLHLQEITGMQQKSSYIILCYGVIYIDITVCSFP